VKGFTENGHKVVSQWVLKYSWDISLPRSFSLNNTGALTAPSYCSIVYRTKEWRKKKSVSKSRNSAALGVSVSRKVSIVNPHTRSRDRAVGLATDYGMEDWGIRSSSPGRVKNIICSTTSRPALGPTQPPIQWVAGALSKGVMQPGRVAHHSTPTSAEIKKTWNYTGIPTYVFTASCLIT
jgi:hypothetical protein